MSIELHNHPLIRHHMTILRDSRTTTENFRRSALGITGVLITEAAKLLNLDSFQVQTPLELTEGAKIRAGVVLVPVLRAGVGMLDGALAILPDAAVGYVGLERDEATAMANCYYSKMPPLESAQIVYILDPMLATGGSAISAIEQLKDLGATRITMVSIIAAPEGMQAVQVAHPDVSIITGVVDRALNEQKYILPGLGDFGDRLYRT